MMNSNQLLSSTEKSLSILYLTISCNFLASLFGCQVQRMLQDNHLVRHLVGFTALLVFTDLAEMKGPWRRTSRRLALALAVYGLFIVSTRLRLNWWLAFMGVLSLMVILAGYHDEDEESDAVTYEEGSTQRVDPVVTVQCILRVLMVLILGIGFALYVSDRRREYGPDFRWSTFIMGTSRCKNNGIGGFGNP